MNYRRYGLNLVLEEIGKILPRDCTVYLTGSLAADAFAPGWSDIDLLTVKNGEISEREARDLVHLKGLLAILYPGNGWIRLYEGSFVSRAAFLGDGKGRMVYWGAGRERITNRYFSDAFSRLDLLDNAQLLSGEDLRPLVKRPTHREIYRAIYGFFRNVRRFETRVTPALETAGFLLDLSRDLYTLATDRLISKPAAGRWVIEEGLCPDPDIMEKVLEIRAHADVYREDRVVRAWIAHLGPAIQQMADVVEEKLRADALWQVFAEDSEGE